MDWSATGKLLAFASEAGDCGIIDISAWGLAAREAAAYPTANLAASFLCLSQESSQPKSLGW